VASVAGAEFLAAAVAAGLEDKVERVEKQCEELVRRGQFLRACGTELLPDGAVTGRYGFLHALYQSVLYQRLTAMQHIRFHRRIGAYLEGVYSDRARELAAELAIHFERGQVFPQAVKYLQQAAENALQRSAYREATDHLRKGLGLLQTFPDMPEWAQYEMTLHVSLGVVLTATQGYAAPEVGSAYARARALFAQVEDNPHSFHTLFGVWLFHLLRAELAIAEDIAEQCWHFAQRHQDPSFHVGAHIALGITRFHTGQFTVAKEHLERSLARYDPHQSRSYLFTYGQDLESACLNYKSWALWHLGYPDQALAETKRSLALAERLSHRFTHSFALDNTAGVHQFRREGPAAQTMAEAEIALSREHEFPLWLGVTTQ
jgi:tetratricopeptide (TPR) repeat protein